MNEVTHILDLRGLLAKRFHGNEDKTALSWELPLLDFVDQHITPLLSGGVAARQVIAVLDAGNTYRRNLFPKYKEKRRTDRDPDTEKAINTLTDNAKTLLAYLGVKCVWVPGEEADDVIALLCERLPGHKTIHTVDADLLALVDEQTQVLRGGRLYAHPPVMGFTHDVPYSLVSLNKALVGDSSDGYTGVKGLGPKAWDELLETYGEEGLKWLAYVLDSDDPAALKPYAEGDKLMAKIYHQWMEALIGWKLAKLNPEVCYGSINSKPKRPEWKVRVPSESRVRAILEECAKIARADDESREDLTNSYLSVMQPWFPTQKLITSDNVQDLVEAMPAILAAPIVAYDYESSDKLQHPEFRQASDKNYVDVIAQELAGISIYYGPCTFYVSFDHADTHNLSKDWASWIMQSLDSREERCVVQNASFELAVTLMNLAFVPRAPYDTQIMASYVDENEESHLKGMSQRLLNYRQISYQEATGGKMMCEVPAEQVLRYGCDDSLVTAILFDLFKTIMHLEKSWDFYQKYEVDPAVDDAWSFVGGTAVDYDRLTELRQESAQRAEQAEQVLRGLLAEHSNSPEDPRVTEAATTLLNEWWETAQFKYEDAEEQVRNDAYNALWIRAWDSCFYSPPVIEKQVREFVPTLLALNSVIKTIDHQAPALKSISAKEILAYEAVLDDFLSERSKLDRASIDLHEFFILLRDARTFLKPGDRSGNNYDKLKQFCQDILADTMPSKVVSQGTTLNLGSSVQMQQMLYGLMMLPVRRRSKVTEGSLREKKELKGAPATGLKAIASAFVWDLPDENDWRREALENYGVVCKERQLESLYFSKLPLWQHPVDGLIHPQIRNCGTATRRPTGSNPNMLQIAKGPMRTMFRAGEGRAYVSLDFASQELHITAEISKDPQMLNAFVQTPRMDLHSLTASGLSKVLLSRLGVKETKSLDYEEFVAALHGDDDKMKSVCKTIRNKFAKQTAFGIIYGSSPVGLAENLQIPKEDAERVYRAYMDLYPRVEQWQEECAAFARKHGYVEMPYGSRRHAIADLWSSDQKLSGRQERQLGNSQIQSGAAEILKVVRQEMFERRMRERYEMRSILEIYDEITCSVPVSKVADYIMEMAEIMRVQPPGFSTALDVDAKVGYTWGSQIEIASVTPANIESALAKLRGESEKLIITYTGPANKEKLQVLPL